MDPEPAHPLEVLETLHGYRRHFMEVELWRPFVAVACQRHDLSCTILRPGLVGTFPTFIVDEQHVVKLFGRIFDGATGWRVEKEAAKLMAGLPEIPVPRLLAAGALESAPGWNYLIFNFIDGTSIGEVYQRVAFEDRLALANRLGNALQRMHALQIPCPRVLPVLDADKQRGWLAGRRSERWRGWPEHLACQVDAYLDLLGEKAAPRAHHFIHADLTRDHVLGKLANGRWTTLALIDFGDAMLGDIFYELAALHLDLFDGDKRLLASFLESYGLLEADRQDFTPKAMAAAMHHQFEVFVPLLERHPQLKEIRTLQGLAISLWDLNAPGVED